jgi:hypothetical protein
MQVYQYEPPSGETWKPIKVRVKATGEFMTIKDIRFNPELFEKIEDGGVHDSTPILEEEGVIATVINVPIVEIMPDNIENMPFFSLKAQARKLGLSVTKEMKKPELLELLKMDSDTLDPQPPFYKANDR